jgi:UDP-N-acetylmuramate--alanine ligase
LNSNDLLDKVNTIHFVGIGGSGMCPIAEILFKKGYRVTGSDVYNSDTLERIRSYGITIFMGHKKENINDADLVVYSAAVSCDNEELVFARQQGKIVLERSAMLGIVTRKYKNFIAVCGTHGKTTTTAMLTQIFLECDFDPTAIVGGHFYPIGGNSVVGESDTIICEACEYVDTFLKLSPSVSVILNIEADHLDYFKNLQSVKRSFKKFASQTSKFLVVNGDDKNTLSVIQDTNLEVITFGFDKSNDYSIKNLSDNKARFSFSLFFCNKKVAKISLKIPGKHNVYNAIAAAATAHKLGALPESISKALSNFKGVHRRFEVLGEEKGVTVADDFAHHPTELKATFLTAEKMGFNRIIAIFQPYTYSRTYNFLDDFVKVLSIPNKVILSEILAARESNIYHIFSKDLAKKIKGCIWFKTFEEISNYVTKNFQKGDLIITLGGGNIYKCANMILDKLKS